MHPSCLLQIKKELHPDGIVAIMSGDYVQRGNPAIYDKYTRTRKALENGVHLVLELPVQYALSSAEEFAYGALSILEKTGIVNTLAFGTEYNADSAKDFLDMAHFLRHEPDEYRLLLKTYLKEGYSYPKARFLALQDYQSNRSNCIPLNKELLETPNAILGVEYAKAILALSSSIALYPIKRKGSISAHKIREKRLSEQKSGMYLDDFTLPFLWEFANTHTAPAGNDFSEELYQRLRQTLSYKKTLSELIMDCKTKQYTYSRICRCFMRFLLQLDRTNVPMNWQYAKILGFNKSHTALIKEMKKQSSIPVIQKRFQDSVKLDQATKNALALDAAAHNRYITLASHKYPDKWELKTEEKNGVIMV